VPASGPVVMPPAASAPPTSDAPFQLPVNGAAGSGAQMPPTMGPSPAVGPSDSSLPPSIGGPAAQGTVAGPGPNGDEIYDIRPPLFFLRSWTWLWLVLATMAAVGALYLLWRWLTSRRKVNPQTAYDLALEKLERARELMNEEDPAPYGVAVSEAIRTYLNQRFQAASAQRTTEEFLRLMQDRPNTPLAEHRDLLGAFLQACDLLKFARYRPGLAELEQVQQRAVSFVTATKPVAVENANQSALVPRTT
jgi:hypothetical protein